MTQLFQYRFANGGLEGHSFGNLFLTALAEITGSMDQAIVETGRVLAIEGRVLPSTLQDNVTLVAEVRLPGETPDCGASVGELQIPESGGKIERVFLQPDQVPRLSRSNPGDLKRRSDCDRARQSVHQHPAQSAGHRHD